MGLLKVVGRTFKDSLGRSVGFPRGSQDEIITDEITFDVSFNFESTLSDQVIIESKREIKNLGGDFTTFKAGDVVDIKFDVQKLDPSTGNIVNISFDGSRTIEFVDGNMIRFTTDIFIVVNIAGEILPSSFNSPFFMEISLSPGIIDVKYNLILNEDDEGDSSLIDGQVNRLVVNVDGMASSDVRNVNVIGFRSGGAILSATIQRLATVNRYKLVVKYWNWLKFELLNEQKPIWFNAESSVKPSVRIKALREEGNPNAFLEENFAYLLGSVGWYGELYNQGDMPWSVSGVIFKDPDDNITQNIDHTKLTKVQITLTGTSNFQEKCAIALYRLPQLASDYKTKQTAFQDNVLATIAVKNGGVTVDKFGVNGAEMNVTNFTTDITTANTLVINFDLTPNAEYTEFYESLPDNERRYRLSVSAQYNDNTWASDIVRTGDFTEAPIIGGEIEEVDTFGFLNHAEPISSCGCVFTSAFTEDDIVARAVLNLNKADNYESFKSSFRLVKDSTGEFFELWQNGRTINMLNFPIDNNGVRFLDYSEDLGYNLPAIGRNTLELKYTGNQTDTTYEVNFLQTLLLSWRDWVSKPQALSDFLDFNLANNGLNDEWVRYAQDGFTFVFRIELVKDGVTFFKNFEIEINNYDSTSVESDFLYKTSDNTNVNVIVNGDTMTVEAVHHHPDPWDLDNLWGWIALRGKNQDPRPQISTEWAHTQPNAPLLPLVGLDRVKKELVDPNMVKLSARFNTISLPSDVTFVSRIQSPMVNGGGGIPINAFIFDVRVRGLFTIPTTGGGYNYNAYWYEVGNPSNSGESLELTGNHTLVFPTEGQYRIGIVGNFPRIFFNNTGDRLEIIDIIQWGNIVWSSMANSFFGCENLTTFTATDAPNLGSLTSLLGMFRNCTNLNAAIGHWDVSNVTNMSQTFNNSSFNQPLNSWNVSNVTNMSFMFNNSSFNQPLNSWNVSKVTNMSFMFNNTPFNQDISMWNVSNVTNMMSMFAFTPFNQPLNSWNVSNVTNMSQTFNNSSFNQDISMWNVSNVTNMSVMFANSSFNQPLNSWNVSNVTNMSQTFANSSFNQPLNSWNVSNVTNMSVIFNNTPFNQPLNSWNVSNVTNMSQTFANSSFNQDISMWNVSNVTNMSFMFNNTPFNQDISMWNVSNVTNMIAMFQNASIFNQDLKGWCVTLISEEPSGFATGSALTNDNKPIWGTCP